MVTEKTAEKLGRYEILAVLGQGAMGIVYKAIDPLIDRTVAIKTIHLDLSRDELANFEERFYREAKSAGRLNHPNIVTIHDVGKTENVAYMAMEFLEGQALREILDVHTALSIDRIVEITAQIAEGLAYAHENGIVHRDIKPANIMLVRDGVAKITDFGIAQTAAGSRTLSGTVLGSPKYMSPEQVLGQPVDGRSDLFSLGVVFYEMLTGEAPFTGDNINTMMYRILNESPVPPQTLAPRIPAVFNTIIARLLAKNPDERYQNARELLIVLKNYKTPPPLQPGNAPEASARGGQKNRPRSKVGEETVLLSKAAGISAGAPQAAGEARPFRKQVPGLRPHASALWKNPKILISSILVLLLVFTGVLFLGKPAQPEKAPQPPLIAATLSRIDSAPENNILQPAPATLLPLPAPSSDGVPASAHKLSAPTAASESQPMVAPKPPVQKVKPGRSETQASAPPSSQVQKNAKLSFAISPWGNVYVDGKKMGASPPLRQITVTEGKHTIEIRNLSFASYSQTIDVSADTTTNIKYIFK